LASVTDARNLEQILRLQNILKNMGVFEQVKKLGIKDGNTIALGHLEFAYYEDEMYQT
jgi:GTP-binding protein